MAVRFLYTVKNRSGQELPVDVIQDGISRRAFLLSGGSVISETLTSTVKTLESRKLVRVSKHKEKEVTQEEVVHKEVREEVIEIPITSHGVQSGFESDKFNLEELLKELSSEELLEISKELSVVTHGATKQDSLIRKLLVEGDRVKDYLLNIAEVND